MSKMIENFKSHLNSVVALDLVNGAQIVTKILNIDEKSNEIEVGKMIFFQPIPNPSNPNDLQMQPIPYGAPFFNSKDKTVISMNSVIMLFEPSYEMSQAYIKTTSGILPANDSMMNNLKNLDLSGLKN